MLAECQNPVKGTLTLFAPRIPKEWDIDTDTKYFWMLGCFTIYSSRLIVVTPSHGVIFCRAVQPGDRLEQEQCIYCNHLEIQTISPQSNIQWLSNICFRHKSEQDHSDVCHGMKRAKEMLDKDSVFFWRLFQDIFKTSNINFTGIFGVIFFYWSCFQDCWWCQMSAVQQVKRSSVKRIQTLPSLGEN